MTVASVHYYETDDALPAYYGDASPTAHDVGLGVELELDEATLSLFWVNPRLPDGDYAAHLVSVARPMHETPPGYDAPRYDVSHWPEWQPYLGRRLQRLEHVGHPDFPWRIAVRLAFDDATVTVALGDTDVPGDLAYSIDNLLVFHDDRTARAYLDFLRTVPESFAKVLPAADLERPPP